MLLVGIFALLTTLSATVGTSGVISHAGARRRELGLRLALGARPRDLRLMVLREGLWLGLSGIAAGALFASLFSRPLDQLLIGVSPDLMSSLALSALLVTVALIVALIVTSDLPARRASRLAPTDALKSD